MIFRTYQQASLDHLYQWWMTHPEITDTPLLVIPTGGGKSIICAELTRLLWDTWPDEAPRTLVLTPSKELAEQNADKLARLLPSHLHLDYYSASVGRKRPDADVIVATIGSVYRQAHLLGNIKAVIIDECFAAGTPVSTPDGNVAIENVRVGDQVHTATGYGTVQAISNRTVKKLNTVRFSDGTILRVTDNHPFFTPFGWVLAKDLARGTGVIRLQDMPALWGHFSTLDNRQWDREGMQDTTTPIIRESKILLDLLLKESGERNVGPWSKGKDEGDASTHSAQTIENWWKRPWNDHSTEDYAFNFATWMDSRTCNKDEHAEEQRKVSNELQSRYWKRGDEDCNRAGWKLSYRDSQRTRQEERQLPSFAWVESVSCEECGRDEVVFNLHVSGHPSYFAGGMLVHNCHLVNPDGPGMYRQLLRDLAKYCQFRVVGMTATPFRGNGVWLTDGKDPLFTGIAYEVKLEELLQAGHLAPLVRPVDAIQTRIDTHGISTASGDYAVDALTERVAEYLTAVADETLTLAAERKKWLAFMPSVRNAAQFLSLLHERGVPAAMVTGETPKKERAQAIEDYRAGRLRCLVTVLALTTGFDVPDVDCLIWCRPTISPVLYVQGAGRGLRIAPDKQDCLWLDFSDTTERLGPIDQIRGRKKAKRAEDAQAPYAVCDQCGAQVRPASLLNCPECGAVLRDPEERQFVGASNAAILSRQLATKINRYEVDRVTYHTHRKPGSPDSMRVEYWSGMRVVAREWICLGHVGFAKQKALNWWQRRMPADQFPAADNRIESAVSLATEYAVTPAAILVNETGKFPEIIKFEWVTNDQDRTRGSDWVLQAGAGEPATGGGDVPELQSMPARHHGVLDLRADSARFL